MDSASAEHLIEYIDAGGTNYKRHARAFGYPPEQFVKDLVDSANAAEYRRVHSDDPEVQRIAEIRYATLRMISDNFHYKTDRGWADTRSELNYLEAGVSQMDTKIASLQPGKTEVQERIQETNRRDYTVERDAYQHALDLIDKGRGA